MKIQPVSTWQNGEQKEANNFVMRIVDDNLETSCNFYYELQNVTEVILEENVTNTIVDILNFGNLTLQGEAYQKWDADPSANEWAYNWALTTLKLVAI